LIAHNRDVEQIRAFLGVDSIAFLSLEGLLACMDRPGADYCTACFSGDYRIDVEHAQTGVVVGEGQMGMF
jgi:amidophosphoribosyltransferase